MDFHRLIFKAYYYENYNLLRTHQSWGSKKLTRSSFRRSVPPGCQIMHESKIFFLLLLDESLNLYASHKMFLMSAAKRLRAHWRKVKPEPLENPI